MSPRFIPVLRLKPQSYVNLLVIQTPNMRVAVVLILLSVGLAISREINTDTAKDGKQTMEDRIEAFERAYNSRIESVELAYKSGLEDVKNEVIQLKEYNTKILNSLNKTPIRKNEQPRSPPQTNAMIASEDQTDPPQDCAEILSRDPSAKNGIYQINVGSKRLERLVDVVCDMETDGGGWTVFQRRMDGYLNFYQDYQTYADGFGLLQHEFWLGNKNIHQIMSRMNYELRVDLEEFSGATAHAQYTSFLMKSACDGYELFVTGHSGSAGDSLIRTHNGMKFSTFDGDQDGEAINCAGRWHGAWWYGTSGCHVSNLNGMYVNSGTGTQENLSWRYWRGNWNSMKATEMKVRPSLLTCPI